MGLRRALPLALLLGFPVRAIRQRRAFAVRGGARQESSHTAHLNYQEPHPTLATGRYIDREDEGDVVDTVSPQPVEMADARQLDEPATLERMGFCLEKHPTAVRDFRDDTAVGEVLCGVIRPAALCGDRSAHGPAEGNAASSRTDSHCRWCRGRDPACSRPDPR